MVKLDLNISGIEETIDTPVTVSIVNDVKKLIGISPDTHTSYDVRTKIKKSKNRLGVVTGDNNIHDRIVNVEYKDIPLEGYEIDMTTFRTDYPYIYNDPDIGAHIQPVYSKRKLNIKINYQDKSKARAYKIVNILNNLPSTESFHKYHAIEYHYNIENNILVLLNNINNLKNTYNVEYQELEQYINDTFDERVTYINPVDGNIYTINIGIREAQENVIGYATDDLSQIDAVYNEDTGRWEIEFNYEVLYEKPTMLQLTYPILVYNQKIDKEFIVFPERVNRNAVHIGSSEHFHNILNRNDLFGMRGNNEYLTVPTYDTFKFKKHASNHLRRILGILTIVDTNDLRALFNVKEIPKVSFKQPILDMLLTTEYPFISDIYSSIFLFELYKNDSPDPINKIQLTQDGTLTTMFDMDVKSIYRVSISLIVNLEYLTLTAKDRMKSYIRNEIANLQTDIVSDSKYILVDDKAVIDPATMVYFEKDNIIDAYLNILNVENTDIQHAFSSVPAIEELLFKISYSINTATIKTQQYSSTTMLNAVFDKK